MEALHKLRALDYFGRLAPRYDELRVRKWPWAWLLGFERRAVLAAGDWRAGGSLLDVGCGSGFYARHGRSRGMHVTAVDASPEMVAQVAGRVDVALVADVERLSLGRAFDGVVCAGVLDFVLEPSVAFGRLAAHVAPGGWLAVLVPTRGPAGRLYQAQKWLQGVEVNVFEEAWLRAQAKRCGLAVERVCRPLPHNIVLGFRRFGA